PKAHFTLLSHLHHSTIPTHFPYTTLFRSPNFSEGRDQSVIARIADAIGNVPGVAVLDRSLDTDHHRSVVTFAGDPGAIAEAGLRSEEHTSELQSRFDIVCRLLLDKIK